MAGILLPAALLLGQSFLHLTRVNPGFDPHRVLTFQVDAPPGKQGPGGSRFFREVVRRMNAVPGTSSVSAVASLPLTGDNIASTVEIEGQPTPLGSRPTVDFNAIEPNYFRTLHVALLTGRDFTERDDANSTPLVIINRALAQLSLRTRTQSGSTSARALETAMGPRSRPCAKLWG